MVCSGVEITKGGATAGGNDDRGIVLILRVEDVYVPHFPQGEHMFPFTRSLRAL